MFWRGGDKGIRTPDLYVANVSRYQLCYIPVVGTAELESATSCMSSKRSNQLSYAPVFYLPAWLVKLLVRRKVFSPNSVAANALRFTFAHLALIKQCTTLFLSIKARRSNQLSYAPVKLFSSIKLLYYSSFFFALQAITAFFSNIRCVFDTEMLHLKSNAV